MAGKKKEPVIGQTTTDNPTENMGRPTEYSPELAAELCNYLAEGESLRTVCARDNMPGKTTVFRWLSASNEALWAQDFRDQYARAKEEAADAMAEEILYIADTPQTGIIKVTKPDKSGKIITELHENDMLGHRRLQVDTRKFLMAKMKPKRYGDKLDITTDGEKIGRGMTEEDIDAVLARAELEAAERAKQANSTPQAI